jgi:superfamily I DNA/RNA helicase
LIPPSTTASPSPATAYQKFAKFSVPEGLRSKKTYDTTTNGVTISTIHIVKGLVYSTVFLLGLDFLEPRDWFEDQLDRLTYVAITRARYQLFIPYINQSSLTKKL